jgi:hypothetical protein
MSSIPAIIMLVIAQAAVTTPAPSAAPSSEPEIGRVRTVAPSCVAMHDLVVPTFAQALKADASFAQATPWLAGYAENIAKDGDPHLAQMYLSRMGQTIATMLQAMQPVAKALGDPKLKGEPGGAVDDEHKALEQLFETEMGRLTTLNEFYLRQTTNAARAELQADDGAFARSVRHGSAPEATPTPFTSDRTMFGQPNLDPNVPFVARNEMNAWSAGMSAQVRESEAQAARIFYPLAKSCNVASPAPSPAPSALP